MTDRDTPPPGALRGLGMGSSLMGSITQPFKMWMGISGIRAAFMA